MAHFTTSLFRISACAALLAGAAVFSTPAQAGFQWSPPTKADTAPALVKESALPNAGPIMPAMPQGKVDSADLAQMPGTLQVEPLAQPDMAPPAGHEMVSTPPVHEPESAPMMARMTMPAEMPKAAPVAKETGSPYAEAVGFGSDMPLALAMRQIVPAQYAFVFDQSINQGAKVTWNGGKPWDEVLNDALKPLGYKAAISGNTVQVLPEGANPQSAASAHTAATGMSMPMAVMNPTGSTAPVKEVYVRRNESGTDKTQAPSPEKESSFWSDINPMNWGSQKEDTPPPPQQGKIETVNTSAQQSSAMTAPANQIPSGPDAKPDMASPDMATADQQPVMLTRGPAMPVPDSVSSEKLASSTSDIRSWQAGKGESLKEVLKKWSDEANVQLYWVPSQDFKLNAPISLQGSYTDAVSSVLASYGDQGPRPVGRLHPNLPSGPAVLIIEPSSS